MCHEAYKRSPYQKCQTESFVDWLNVRGNRFTIVTYLRLKMSHGYFRSYIQMPPAWDGMNSYTCERKQTPQHLFLDCPSYRDVQTYLRQKVQKELSMSFRTPPGPKNSYNQSESNPMGSKVLGKDKNRYQEEGPGPNPA